MPQSQPRSDLRAGLFILISIALIVGIVIGIKGVHSLFTPMQTHRVRFSLKDDLGGLAIGDDVRLGGFKVGVIKSIEVAGFGDHQPPSILVTFTMPTKYPLRKDAHLGIQTELTGSTNLNIDSLGEGETLADGGELSGHPSPQSTLFASLGEIAPQVRDVVAEFKAKTLPKLTETAGKASDTLTSIRNASDSISALFGDTKTDFRTTVANLSSITTTAKAKLPDILDHADKVMVDARETIDKARGAMEDVQATAANAKNFTADARGLIEGNKGKFQNIIAGLKESGDNLKGATAEIRRSPWRLLYHPGPGELDNLELYDAARQFADGANNVDDAALALRDALNSPNVDKAQVQKLVNNLNTTFSNFNSVEQKLWKTVKPE
jgi:ABC-type transporter Mla subunit MlaD